MCLAKPAGLQAPRAGAARAPVARAVSCSAQKQEAGKQVATGVAAAALALTFGFGAVDAAYADVAGLTPCSESKAFAKRKKNEVRAAGGSRRHRAQHLAKLPAPAAAAIAPAQMRLAVPPVPPRAGALPLIPLPPRPSCPAGQGPEQAPEEREQTAWGCSSGGHRGVGQPPPAGAIAANHGARRPRRRSNRLRQRPMAQQQRASAGGSRGCAGAAAAAPTAAVVERAATERRHWRPAAAAAVPHRRRRLPPSPAPQYEEGSAPALALQATIERTEKRFDK